MPPLRLGIGGPRQEYRAGHPGILPLDTLPLLGYDGVRRKLGLRRLGRRGVGLLGDIHPGGGAFFFFYIERSALKSPPPGIVKLDVHGGSVRKHLFKNYALPVWRALLYVPGAYHIGVRHHIGKRINNRSRERSVSLPDFTLRVSMGVHNMLHAIVCHNEVPRPDLIPENVSNLCRSLPIHFSEVQLFQLRIRLSFSPGTPFVKECRYAGVDPRDDISEGLTLISYRIGLHRRIPHRLPHGGGFLLPTVQSLPLGEGGREAVG